MMRSGLKKYYKAAINQFLVNHYHSCYELRVSKTRTMAFLPFCTFLTTLSHEKHCLGCAKMETFLLTPPGAARGRFTTPCASKDEKILHIERP